MSVRIQDDQIRVALRNFVVENSGGNIDSTDDVAEGSTNLYYTDARADARVDNAIDTAEALNTSGKTIPGRDAVKTYIANVLAGANYTPQSRTIAGLALSDNITAAQLRTAVGMSRILLYKNNVSSSLTGTTNETIIDNVLVPGNTFGANDVINIIATFSKSGTAGTLTVRVSVNTTNSLSGVTRIASYAPASSALWIKTSREMIFKNAINSQVVFGSTNTGNPSDIIGTAVAHTTLSVDFSVDQYLILSAQNSSSADTSTLQSWYIEVIRN